MKINSRYLIAICFFALGLLVGQAAELLKSVRPAAPDPLKKVKECDAPGVRPSDYLETVAREVSGWSDLLPTPPKDERDVAVKVAAFRLNLVLLHYEFHGPLAGSSRRWLVERILLLGEQLENLVHDLEDGRRDARAAGDDAKKYLAFFAADLVERAGKLKAEEKFGSRLDRLEKKP